MKKIEDFGMKIGGARKDFSLPGGITEAVLCEMNEAEKRNYVNRDMVWKLQDAKKLVESGVDPFVVYWQRRVRLLVHKSPTLYSPKTFDEDVLNYVRQVQYLKRLVMSCNTYTDVMSAIRVIESWKDMYCDFRSDAPVTYASASYKLLRIRNYVRKFQYYVKETNFPYTERKSGNRKPRKKNFIPPKLEKVEREGKDYRHGFHVTPEMWQKQFAFRGVEFGNWTSQKVRQMSLDCCFDALKDLAFVLNISDKDIAFGGRLSLAFGARGISTASAHYEPLREVINLTKMHGAGCTAHEWFHALDDYIAKFYKVTDGKLASETKDTENIPKTLLRLAKAVKYDLNGNKTDYYRGSLEFDKHYSKSNFGYWSNTAEMLARAFACYVKDSLGCKSDYLIAHADVYKFKFEDQGICAIPQGEERIIFNELFDQLFYELKKCEILHRKEKKLENEMKIAEKQCVYDVALLSEPNGQYSFF